MRIHLSLHHLSHNQFQNDSMRFHFTSFQRFNVIMSVFLLCKIPIEYFRVCRAHMKIKTEAISIVKKTGENQSTDKKKINKIQNTHEPKLQGTFHRSERVQSKTRCAFGKIQAQTISIVCFCALISYVSRLKFAARFICSCF